jgi:hypothetical protein
MPVFERGAFIVEQRRELHILLEETWIQIGRLIVNYQNACTGAVYQQRVPAQLSLSHEAAVLT